jgi:hypothetical protein
VSVKPGWRGRFFEDFEVGDVYEHPLGRTVTQPRSGSLDSPDGVMTHRAPVIEARTRIGLAVRESSGDGR